MKQLTQLGLILSLFSTPFCTYGKFHNNEVPHVDGEMIIKLKFNTNQSEAFKRFQGIGVTYDRVLKLTYGTLYVVKFNATEKSIQSVQGILQDDPSVEYAEPNFIYNLIKPVKPKTIKGCLLYTSPSPRD